MGRWRGDRQRADADCFVRFLKFAHSFPCRKAPLVRRRNLSGKKKRLFCRRDALRKADCNACKKSEYRLPNGNDKGTILHFYDREKKDLSTHDEKSVADAVRLWYNGNNDKYEWSRQKMSKYEPLWEYLKENDKDYYKLSYDEIRGILGFEIDHSFLTFKKESKEYGYTVGKISMKEKTIVFDRI